jgi:hypothetical protein
LDDPGIDGRIILSWIFRKWDRWGIDWIDLERVGTGGGYLCGSEPSGSVKCVEILD